MDVVNPDASGNGDSRVPPSVIVRYVNSATVAINKCDTPFILPAVTYSVERTATGEFGKIVKYYEDSTAGCVRKGKMADFLWSGHLPRIRSYLQSKGSQLIINGHVDPVTSQEPYLPLTKFPDGRTFSDFRDDQKELINRARVRQAGVVVGFTGFGKTITAFGIMSCFPTLRFVYIAHTQDLINQPAADLDKFGMEYGVLHGGRKDWENKRIVLATRQSFIKLPIVERRKFKGVIVDETHHIADFHNQYYKILFEMQESPVRIGLTATVHPNLKSQLVMEAMLGPVIGEIGLKKGVELKLAAEPVVYVHSLGRTTKCRSKKGVEVYLAAIVRNEERNYIIATDVKRLVDARLSVLVFVRRIEHGEVLQRVLREVLGIPVPFVHGSLRSINREKVKASLKAGEYLCGITNVVWREGIDIPKLDAVINAGSGRSVLELEQTIGRAVRAVEGKTKVLVVDYEDDLHRTITEAFHVRSVLYSERGWKRVESIEGFMEERKRG